MKVKVFKKLVFGISIQPMAMVLGAACMALNLAPFCDIGAESRCYLAIDCSLSLKFNPVV